jgi:hypothetical protein
MIDKYIINKNYTSCYPDPIILKKNEVVLYGKEDTEFPNWIYCTSLKSSKEGWVPKQILSLPNPITNESFVQQDYSAHELTVRQGEVVIALYHLNDWSYCKTSTEELGWIPSSHLTKTL